jgi:exonuclease SbcD
MGHLYTAGGDCGDGVRALYLGDICQIEAGLFPPFDYLALGHLHRQQIIGKNRALRYSGAPIPMGFSEAKHRQYILDVTVTDNSTISVTPVEIPRSTEIVQIAGTLDEIQAQIFEYKSRSVKVLAEVLYTGRSATPIELTKAVRDWTKDSRVSVIRTEYTHYYNPYHDSETALEYDTLKSETSTQKKKRLEELNEEDVFLEYLSRYGSDLDPTAKESLHTAYRQICTEIHEKDSRSGAL